MTVLKKMAFKFMPASICIIIGSLYNPVDAGSFCFQTSSLGGISSEYCDYGCCYDYTSSPCCAINVGLIVGAVIGSLVGVSLLISGICLIIHCSKAHTRRSPMIAPQIVTTNTQQMPMQPMQPMVYQPFYQAPVTAYPAYPAYPAPSGLAMPSSSIYPSTAEPLPPPIYVEGSRQPTDIQKR
ncbi:hypothetical protein ACJMK2_016191 [Sinanodonta woodiana]|uniref:Cysteine and tyrosine-rich protein 1 n=1 Tax=Sinanodonta woodiana TaxID=1069815 RepID=A0ABD3UU05_SINWO